MILDTKQAGKHINIVRLVYYNRHIKNSLIMGYVQNIECVWTNMRNRLFRIFKKHNPITFKIDRLDNDELMLQVYDKLQSHLKQAYFFQTFNSRYNWWTDKNNYSMLTFVGRLRKYEN
jgi:hypothetical protein